jgi:hypothetical protein
VWQVTDAESLPFVPKAERQAQGLHHYHVDRLVTVRGSPPASVQDRIGSRSVFSLRLATITPSGPSDFQENARVHTSPPQSA